LSVELIDLFGRSQTEKSHPKNLLQITI
jgi:hypothetical protein